METSVTVFLGFLLCIFVPCLCSITHPDIWLVVCILYQFGCLKPVSQTALLSQWNDHTESSFLFFFLTATSRFVLVLMTYAFEVCSMKVFTNADGLFCSHLSLGAQLFTLQQFLVTFFCGRLYTENRLERWKERSWDGTNPSSGWMESRVKSREAFKKHTIGLTLDFLDFLKQSLCWQVKKKNLHLFFFSGDFLSSEFSTDLE